LSENEKIQYKDTTSFYRSYLTEATGFYIGFIIRIHTFFGIVDSFVIEQLQLVWQNQSESCRYSITMPKSEFIPDLIKVVYRSLICLGDLARYREIHADKRIRNWNLAQKFYKLANYIKPECGTAFNQLAVIDSHKGNDFCSIQLYLHSLVASEPFLTALENLQKQLEKVKDDVTIPSKGFRLKLCSLIGCWFFPTKKYCVLI
jgi:hypothetical protein